MATEKQEMIPAKNIDLNGFRLKFEVKGVPVQFANAIRRILLNEMPVVEVANVKINENTTLMPHEMLLLRTELLPVNVRPVEEDLIRSAKLSLSVSGEKRVYTSDFVVSGGRKDILLKDRDMDTPLYFLKVKEGESVNLTAGLRINTASSHCCVATYMYHVDPELAEEDKEEFVTDNEGWDGAARVFDNFYRQRSYHRNEKGRPDWFDFEIESIGVIPARELAKEAFIILKKGVAEWAKNDIVREKEDGVYRIVAESGGHTVGALVQAVLYESGLCQFVSYDMPHPLRSEMIVRFLTGKNPEEIVAYALSKVNEYCDTCLSLL
jgi:DNA-directed RNA polymerase subunit L